MSTFERFKTISRRDPEFLSYLNGRFSATHRALPVRSLNVDTLSEEVTFEIRSLNEIATPTLPKIIWQLMRPATLLLSLGPMIATLFYCLAHRLEPSMGVVLSSFIGVLFFHISLNLFNDYSDHIKGQDRLRPTGGTRVIQKGWLPAFEVRRAAWILLALAVVCALPAIVLHFAPVAIVGGVTLLAGLEFAFQKLRLKYRGFAEVMAFALTGPLLTSGFAWAIAGQLVWPDVAALGAVFGAISLMYFHAANFENIMADSQAGVSTWATRAGFDASKRFFDFTAGLTLFASVSYVGFESEPRLLPLLFAQVLALIPLVLRVKKLASPLSSELTGLRGEVLRLSWITLVALVGGFFWMLTAHR